jgi:hypothetical protein
MVGGMELVVVAVEMRVKLVVMEERIVQPEHLRP